jgi:hypothetical protein
MGPKPCGHAFAVLDSTTLSRVSHWTRDTRRQLRFKNSIENSRNSIVEVMIYPQKSDIVSCSDRGLGRACGMENSKRAYMGKCRLSSPDALVSQVHQDGCDTGRAQVYRIVVGLVLLAVAVTQDL